MKFSFIIPVLNEEEYIEPCIRSILNQTCTPYEIIVVDNGCQDKTIEIAKKLGCQVVRENKKGISYARNKGAGKAKGDIYCFVDADGILRESWLSEAKKVLSNKRVDAVSGLNIFASKKPIKLIWYNSYTLIVYSIIFFLNLIFEKSFLAGNNLAIQGKTFWKLGGFEPVIGEDYWFSRKFSEFNYKSVLNLRMVIYYSSRRFISKGYLKTVIFWIVNTLRKIPQTNYSLKQS